MRLEYSTKIRKNINLREEFLIVFQKMKQVDNTIAIVRGSISRKDSWLDLLSQLEKTRNKYDRLKDSIWNDSI